MPNQLFDNVSFFAGSLLKSCTDSTTTLTLKSGHGDRYPSTGTYLVKIDDEIFSVSSRSGDILTVTGGQNSTQRSRHSDGSIVGYFLNVDAIDNIVNGGGGGGITIDTTEITGGADGYVLIQTNGKVSESTSFTFTDTAGLGSVLTFTSSPIDYTQIPAILGTIDHTSSGVHAADITGGLFNATQRNGDSTAAYGGVSGFVANAVLRSGAKVGYTQGMAALTRVIGTGSTITDVAGYYAALNVIEDLIATTINLSWVDLIGSGITAPNVALFRGVNSLSGSNAITNLHGILLDPITQGTNNWAIKTGTGLVEFGDAVKITGKSVQISEITVAALPTSPVAGMRASVSDSDATSFTLGIGAVVAGGGSTHVPVYYDGTNWRIG